MKISSLIEELVREIIKDEGELESYNKIRSLKEAIEEKLK